MKNRTDISAAVQNLWNKLSVNGDIPEESINDFLKEVNDYKINYSYSRAVGILDRMSFFQGQRYGREMWSVKSEEVQNKDLEQFNDDLNTIRILLDELYLYWIRNNKEVTTIDICDGDR